MTIHICDICGVELKLVNDNWFCPNHGIRPNREESTEENVGYVG